MPLEEPVGSWRIIDERSKLPPGAQEDFNGNARGTGMFMAVWGRAKVGDRREKRVDARRECMVVDDGM